MKKFKKLSINKMQGFPAIGVQEQVALKGGTSAFGWQEYYNLYGTYPPGDTGYNPDTDTCYSITDNIANGSPNGTIGESDYERYNSMNEYYGENGGPHQGPITQLFVRWINGW